MTEYTTPLMIPADPDGNVTDLLLDRVAESPDRALFSIPADDGSWTEVTATEFLAQVRALAKGFAAAGVEPGERIGLMCRTRYEWTLVDFAASFAGIVIVPVYETSSPAQIHFALTDSGATALVLETPEHFARYDEIAGDLSSIATVWQIDRGDLDRLAVDGAAFDEFEMERRRTLARGSDMATLIYTSGSTGVPKGCVLTHSNFVELSRNAGAAMHEVVHEGASTLLFITLAHVFARFISILALHAGVKVGHQADTRQLLPALASFQPTFLLAVPRVFEKVYNSAEQKAEAGGKGRIFRKAADVAVEHSMALQDGRRIGLGLKLQFALFDRLVYSKLREALGGRVEYAVSGSAPLGPRLGHFFHSLGITILEGYGLTETTAPATVNLVSRSKIGTTGPALPGVGIRVDDDGLIWVKGINVFDGYWKNDEATAASFDGEWYNTGDIGVLDDEGYLTITGRKKELIVTAGGKNVAPAALEDPIRAHLLVGQCVVVGDRKPFVAALVTLDPEMLAVWLRNNGESPELSLAEAATHPKVLAELQRAIDAANANVSRAESVRKFTVLPVEFTEATGHLTPKLSIKRDRILEDFATEIERMYETQPTTSEHTIVH